MQHDEEPGREGGGSCQRAMPTAVEAESSLTSTPRHRNVQKGKRKRTVLSKSLRNEWSTQSPLPYDFNASYDTTRLGDTMVLWNVCLPCPNLKVATLCQTDKQVTRVILKGKSDERKQGGKWRGSFENAFACGRKKNKQRERKRHWESVHRTSVKRRASHFLSPLSAQQQPGRLEDHSRAWNRSDFGYFRLTNTNNPALKQPEL
ncbi:hypothetical protein MJT46_018256 [Ovis ammon polii x Ovis aries]|nr:hypothetical protein MJT46_018256 [Ovis ammon polii x Ovis aries]